MPINEAALEKLRAATFSSETFASVLETICGYKDLLGSGDSQMNLDYQVAGAPVKPGDMIPFIHFGIRQATVSEVAEVPEGAEVGEVIRDVAATQEVVE